MSSYNPFTFYSLSLLQFSFIHFLKIVYIFLPSFVFFLLLGLGTFLYFPFFDSPQSFFIVPFSLKFSFYFFFSSFFSSLCISCILLLPRLYFYLLVHILFAYLLDHPSLVFLFSFSLPFLSSLFSFFVLHFCLSYLKQILNTETPSYHPRFFPPSLVPPSPFILLFLLLYVLFSSLYILHEQE